MNVVKTDELCLDLLKRLCESGEKLIIVCRHEDAMFTLYTDAMEEACVDAMVEGKFAFAGLDAWTRKFDDPAQFALDPDRFKCPEVKIIGLAGRLIPRSFVESMQDVADVVYIDLSRSPCGVSLDAVGLCKKKCTFYFSYEIEPYREGKIRERLKILVSLVGDWILLSMKFDECIHFLAFTGIIENRGGRVL